MIFKCVMRVEIEVIFAVELNGVIKLELIFKLLVSLVGNLDG